MRYSYVFLALIIGLSHIYCFFGIDYQDPFYYINFATLAPIEDTPFMILLSTLATKLAVILTGGKVLYLRFINLSIYMLSFCLPLLLLKGRERAKMALFLAILIMLFGPFITNVLGADTFSTLGIVAVACCAVKYLNTQSRFWFYALIALLSIAMLFRFPNLLLIPVVVLFVTLNAICIKKPKKKYWIEGTILIITPLLISFCIYYLVYGDLSFMVGASNADQSYELKTLFMSYVFNSISVIKIMLLLLLAYGFSFVAKKLIFNRFILLTIHIFILSISIVLTYYWVLSGSLYYRHYGLLLIAIIAIAFITASKKNWLKREMIYVSLVFFLMPIAAAGSNTGLYKMVYCLPLLLLILRYNSIILQQVFVVFLVALVPLAVYGRINGVFQDEPIYKLDTVLNLNNLDGIYTTKEKQDNILQIYNKIAVSNSNNIMLLGQSSHIYKYLKMYKLEYSDFRQKLDFNKIEDFAKSNKTQLIYIDDYPNNTNIKIDDTLRQKIIKLNYRLELFDNYLVINKAKDED